MEWTADVSAGDWIRERLDDPWRGTMHDVVPRGFDAYARVFHPAFRDRPVGEPWPGLPYGSHEDAWEEFQARSPEIEGERVSWADTAAAMGTTFHAGAQWDRLVAPGIIALTEDGPRDGAGWRYHPPEVGGMPAEMLGTIAAVAARYTRTPHLGHVGLWEGSGTLVGHMGVGPSRVFFQAGDGDDPLLTRHNEMLGSSLSDPFNNVFRQATWQEGILSRDISEAPRFELPSRGYVLFRGGVDELTETDWVLRMPWRDRVAETHGFAPDAQTPALIWPDDHAWVIVTEVDYDSTIVGGSASLVDALVAEPALEALPIRAGAALTWDSDEVNR